MSIKIKRTVIFIALIITAICCITAFTLNADKSALAEDGLILEEELKTQYDVSERVVIPDAEFSVGGERTQAVFENVEFPNGKTYKNREIVLETAGKYTVKYSVMQGGKKTYQTISFYACGKAFSVSGDNSTVYYGTSERGGIEGIVVSLASGDKFRYEKPINISECIKSDALLNLYALPEIVGESDVRTLYVRFTDAYDENNYVDVVTFGNYGDENEEVGLALYSGARANGQPITGMHYKYRVDPSYIEYDGGQYAIVRNIQYNSQNGYPSYGSHRGPSFTNAPNGFSFSARDGYGENPYAVSMHYAKKQVFGCEKIDDNCNGMISDLDDPKFYDTLWQGFKTGEVYISIWGDNYVKSSFSFVVTNIYGEDLSVENFIDEVPPIMEVDLLGEESIPYAILNKKYSIYPAKAFDNVDGDINYTVGVYKDYRSSSPKTVAVKDGAFTPTTLGDYSIVYKTKDAFGNQTEKVIDVLTKAESLLNLTLEDVNNTTLKTGNYIKIKTPVVTGANGKVDLKITVSSGEISCDVVETKDGYYFYPLNQGTYKILYECSDYSSETEKEYTLNITANDYPVITGEALFPPMFIKNADYYFPVLSGYDLTEGSPKDKSAEIKYSFDGKTPLTYVKGTSVKIEAENFVDVIYSITIDGGKSCERTYRVKVKDVGFGNEISIKDYFVNGSVKYSLNNTTGYYETESYGAINSQANSDYVKFAVDKNTSMTFLNALLMNEFTLKFNNLSLDGVIKIKFFDSEDLNNGFDVIFNSVDSKSYLVKVGNEENGYYSQTVSESLIAKTTNLSYSGLYNNIEIAGVKIPVNGFDGFISKKAYMEIELAEVNGEGDFAIYEICNQMINSNKSDTSQPLYFCDVDTDSKVIGDYIVILDYQVVDVLNPFSIKKMTVKSPSGNICYSEDGVKLENITDFGKEYKVKVEELGKYVITCYYGDSPKKTLRTFSTVIYSYDKVAPVITLNNKVTLGSVGKSLKIANCTVNDQTDSQLSLSVLVLNPVGMADIIEDNSFTPNSKGVYTVMYYATDASGNLAFEFYEVEVK